MGVDASQKNSFTCYTLSLYYEVTLQSWLQNFWYSEKYFWGSILRLSFLSQHAGILGNVLSQREKDLANNNKLVAFHGPI